MTISGDGLDEVESFKYLEPFAQRDGSSVMDVKRHTHCNNNIFYYLIIYIIMIRHLKV